MPPKAAPKSGKKTSVGCAGIDTLPLVDDKWKVYPFVLDPQGPYSSKYIAEAVQSMKLGQRRRFAAVTVTELVEWARESAKAKAKPKDPSELLIAETCAEAAAACDEAAAANAPFPLDQVARLLKAKMLMQRDTELARREAARQEAEAAAAAAAAAAGGDAGTRPESRTASRPGSKQSKTPKPPKSAPKGKGSKDNLLADDEGVPGKKKSTLLSRAEEEALIDYIDDEPSSGPDAYWCITGVADPLFLSTMAAILAPVKGVLSLFTPDDEDQDKSSTQSLWQQGRAACLQAQPGPLRNIAWVTLNAGPAPEASETYERIAHRIYLNVEQEDKHREYLGGLVQSHVPREPVLQGRVDTALYSSLLDAVPPERIGVATVLDAILTQVEATVAGTAQSASSAPASASTATSEFLARAFGSLAVSQATQTPAAAPAAPAAVRSGDTAAVRALGMPDATSLSMERRVWAASTVAHLNTRLPGVPPLSREERLAHAQQLQSFSRMQPKELERSLLLLEFESFLASELGVEPALVGVQDRAVTEHFDANSFPQVVAQAQATQDAELLPHYYPEQHTMLLALVPNARHSLEGPHTTTASAPTPLGLSNYLEYRLEDPAAGDNPLKAGRSASSAARPDEIVINHFPAPSAPTKTHAYDLGDMVVRTDTTVDSLLAADGGTLRVIRTAVPHSTPYLRHSVSKDGNTLAVHHPLVKRRQFFAATLADGCTHIHVAPAVVDAISRKGLPDEEELRVQAEEARLKAEEEARLKAEQEAADRPKSRKGTKVSIKTPATASTGELLPPTPAEPTAVVEKPPPEPISPAKLFSASVTTREGVTLEFSPDGSIRLVHSAPTVHLPPSHPAHLEASRTIYTTGAVLCLLKSGESRVLLPNGTSALLEPAGASGATWAVHTRDGKACRTAASSEDAGLKDLTCFRKLVPEVSSDVVLTREDGTIFVGNAAAAGDSDSTTSAAPFAVEHANGTRILSAGGGGSSSTGALVQIESLGFPRVEMHPDMSVTTLPDGTRIQHSPAQGRLVVIQSDGTELTLNASGSCQLLALAGVSSEKRPSYTVDFITAELETTDSRGTHLAVAGDSTTRRDGAAQSRAQLLSQLAGASRLFVVHGDGSATEFLRSADVELDLSVLQKGKASAVETVSGTVEGEPNSTYVTLLRKVPAVNLHALAYSTPSILPLPLQRNLAHAHSEFNQSQAGVLVRQLFKHPPLTAARRAELLADLEKHSAWLKDRASSKASLHVSDSRSDAEREDAGRLLALIPALGSPAVTLVSDTAVFEGQVERLMAPPEKPKAKVSGKTRDDYHANDDSASGNLDDMREHLRDKRVPPFFQSEEAARLLKDTLSRNTSELAVLHDNLAKGDQHAKDKDRKAATKSRPAEASEASSSSITAKTASSSSAAPAAPLVAGEEKRPGTSDGSSSPLPPIRPKSGQPLGERTSSAGKRTKPPIPSSAGVLRVNRDVHDSSVGHAVPAPSSSAGDKSLSPYQPLPPIRPRSASNANGDPSATATAQYTGGEVEEDSPEILRSSLRAPIAQGGSEEQSVLGEQDLDSARRTLPKGFARPPSAVPNEQFIQVESPVKRMVRTTSVLSGGLDQPKNRGFDVLPLEADFGTLKEGCTYAKSIKLRNRGVDSCRFKVTQPDPLSGVLLVYTPGPVAAGMEARVDVQFFAQAVNTVNGACEFSCEIEFVTEVEVFKLPVRAVVLTKEEFELRKISDAQRGKGVRLVSTKPPRSTLLVS